MVRQNTNLGYFKIHHVISITICCHNYTVIGYICILLETMSLNAVEGFVKATPNFHGFHTFIQQSFSEHLQVPGTAEIHKLRTKNKIDQVPPLTEQPSKLKV